MKRSIFKVNKFISWQILFVQDTNAIPADYVLQPVTYHFPHYNDLSEANREKNKQERDQWWQIFQSFQRLFKRTAKIAIERNKLTLQQAHKYFSSGMSSSRLRWFCVPVIIPVTSSLLSLTDYAHLALCRSLQLVIKPPFCFKKLITPLSLQKET